ncbi:hypothetical protein BAUCODRAFT_539509 [Baudoinia panamericana UAMH 10762]|uniref:Uncharacterized protein n=1 Tax=Baudoinia panamericana (strain UAMH 10762) TaxID=717646 RepID=M2N994_BAUPA|nr:uncharacterized protein BAUCODRAFT_539509 [Baudoinia panamericana UAMH 10762]EMC95390.1 hypothetical protein BAUCODRAFT_539509 [Baudoinia panamericana UAMH 10762]
MPTNEGTTTSRLMLAGTCATAMRSAAPASTYASLSRRADRVLGDLCAFPVISPACDSVPMFQTTVAGCCSLRPEVGRQYARRSAQAVLSMLNACSINAVLVSSSARTAYLACSSWRCAK